MEARVVKFFNKPRPNVNAKILYHVFLMEEFNSLDETKLSYRHFCRLIKKVTSVKTIRTGGAEINLMKLAFVIAERACRGVNARNTISIDEKPIVIKNYLVRSYRALKNHIGPYYRSLLYGLKIPPFYIIAAVSIDGLVSYQINDKPIHVETFEGFIAHVSMHSNSPKKQFLLYDNASFHNISETCKEIILENNFEITKTPPSGCFCDPIEEFFGIFDSEFRIFYQKKIVESGVYNPLSRNQIKELINLAMGAADRNLKGQFRRALLF